MDSEEDLGEALPVVQVAEEDSDPRQTVILLLHRLLMDGAMRLLLLLPMLPPNLQLPSQSQSSLNHPNPPVQAGQVSHLEQPRSLSLQSLKRPYLPSQQSQSQAPTLQLPTRELQAQRSK